ncbi:DENN domain-containing protein 5B [Linum perenne]
MSEEEDAGSPSWSSSFLAQTTEDVAKAVAAAAATATVRSPRPSVIFSSKEEVTGSPLQKFQRQVSKVIKGISPPRREVRIGNYNPEVLTSQKRQWASFQLQHLDHRALKESSKLFESMVVVGLPPYCDVQSLQRQFCSIKSDGYGRLQTNIASHNQSRVEPILEPQVLLVYPPDKLLPLKYKDLISFCFPSGVEVKAVEKTASMSELNEILLSQVATGVMCMNLYTHFDTDNDNAGNYWQEHFKQSDLSFVFRLQVADDSTLYGCCVLVEEFIEKPSGLLSVVSDKQPSIPTLSRYMLTTRRCYCILTRLPFFELHFGVLTSIFTEERLERLTKGIGSLDPNFSDGDGNENSLEDNFVSTPEDHNVMEDLLDRPAELSNPGPDRGREVGPVDSENHLEHHVFEGSPSGKKFDKVNDDAVHSGTDVTLNCEPSTTDHEVHISGADGPLKLVGERRLPITSLPFLRLYPSESSESSPSFQGSPSEDRNFRSEIVDTETEEASFSGQEESNDHLHILEWAKENNHGSLQILCEYYHLRNPDRGAVIKFHPLEHLHPLEFRRPDETVLHIAGSTIDLRSCSTSLEFAEAYNALLAEEEATALSTWTLACICGALRLEHGILSSSVLSIIPLIRPYQWQSLLMPILPDNMLEFLDAPVPYIVGVKNKTSEVQSKLSNAIVVDINRNQVKSPGIPQLPKHKELVSSLSSYHAKLVGLSFSARRRPVYECTDEQVEAAKGFLKVLRTYLDNLCSNLRSHTITNVQSNNDKVPASMDLKIILRWFSHFPTMVFNWCQTPHRCHCS